ncbi:MAG: ATP-binding protein [candidate division WOR-3 bacterium]
MVDFLTEIFKGLGKEETQKVKELFEEVTFEEDSPIIKEGEFGGEVYILKEGRALVTKKGKFLAELHPGDIFGEMSLLEEKVHSATVFSREKVTLLRANKDSFYKLLTINPKISIYLLKMLSSRLRSIDEDIVEKALQEERLAVLGKLGSTIIHDIKSPLAAIKAYAELLKEKEDDRVRRYAESINKAANFALEMIEDILEFGRDKSSLDVRKVNIYDFLKEVVELFGEDYDGKEIEFKIEVPSYLSFEFDPFKLKRVFINLLKNAKEAIKNKGTVEIGAKEIGDGVELYVKDTGVGMPPNIKDRIFEPFFTYGKRGIGLGMSVVKKIVDEHNGKIEVESIEGKGTTFKIFLFKEERNDQRIDREE